VFGRLVDLWIFAVRYDCVGFQQAVMIQLQRCVDDWEVVPCPTVVKGALDNLKLGAPLCRYLIRCYGYYPDHEQMPTERLAKLPSEFLSLFWVSLFGDSMETHRTWTTTGVISTNTRQSHNGRPAKKDVQTIPMYVWRSYSNVSGCSSIAADE
jgi:hypothetical protein